MILDKEGCKRGGERNEQENESGRTEKSLYGAGGSAIKYAG